jgi:hypothetical protein
VEDLHAFIDNARNKPDLAPEGECREQGGRVVHLGVDIGYGPREDVGVKISSADKHTLQRLGILRTMGVPCDLRKKFLHFIARRSTFL